MGGVNETPDTLSARIDATVAAEIRAELARQRIPHATLAGQLGVSRPYLSRRLSGETPLSVADVARIADLLGVSVVQFTAAIDEQATQ